MNRFDLPENIKTCIKEHHEIVSAELRSYFNDDSLHVSSYRDLFNTEIDPSAEETDFKVSNAIRLAFNHKTEDSSFWLPLNNSYPLLSKNTSVILVHFSTNYLCDTGFSDLASIKTKSRNCIQ